MFLDYDNDNCLQKKNSAALSGLSALVSQLH